jgi:hypothetical protein
MRHLDTLKFNLQTIVCELPTSPQSYDNKKKKQQQQIDCINFDEQKYQIFKFSS